MLTRSTPPAGYEMVFSHQDLTSCSATLQLRDPRDPHSPRPSGLLLPPRLFCSPSCRCHQPSQGPSEPVPQGFLWAEGPSGGPGRGGSPPAAVGRGLQDLAGPGGEVCAGSAAPGAQARLTALLSARMRAQQQRFLAQFTAHRHVRLDTWQQRARGLDLLEARLEAQLQVPVGERAGPGRGGGGSCSDTSPGGRAYGVAQEDWPGHPRSTVGCW